MKLAPVILLSVLALSFGHQLVSAATWEDIAESLQENKESQQPPYKTLSSTDEYEERKYYEAEYAVTNTTGAPFTIAFTEGIAKLYAYFLGRNEDGVRIERTTPAFVRILPTEDFSSVRANNFSIGLYIPKEYQGNAPEPKADDVKIVRAPEGRAYVREFSGFATENKALTEALRLKTALLEDKVRDFSDTYFDLAVYDPPTKLTGRRNEVIFEAGGGRHAGQGFTHMQIPDSILAHLRALYAELFD